MIRSLLHFKVLYIFYIVYIYFTYFIHILYTFLYIVIRMTIRFMQINVDRRSKAQDLARATADSFDIDIIAIQEPNRAQSGRDPRWIVDQECNTALYCRNRRCGVVPQMGTRRCK